MKSLHLFLKNIRRYVFISLIVVCLILVCGVIISFSTKQTKAKQMVRPTQLSLVGVDLAAKAYAFPTPTASPSPTLTPAPVYAGYCQQIPILMYHHTAPAAVAAAKSQSSLNVDTGMLDQQMEYIATHGFTTYSANEVVAALINHTPLAGKPIVITLDDGYDDNYTYAFPIFKKYNSKFTLMVPTGLLGGSSPTNSYFTWSQLKEMLGSGLATVSNHTWSHASMGSSDEKDEFEIVTSQKQFQDNLGYAPNTFTYPYGTGLYTRVMALLQKHGFIGAFSTIPGQMQCDSFIMSLHRTRIGNASFPAYGIY